MFVIGIFGLKNRKANVKKRIKDMAEKLIRVAAQREIINTEKFTISKEEKSNWIDTISRGQGNRAEIENYYLNNEEAKKNMESVILENLAIKWVVGNATVTEKDYTFDDLVELR